MPVAPQTAHRVAGKVLVVCLILVGVFAWGAVEATKAKRDVSKEAVFKPPPTKAGRGHGRSKLFMRPHYSTKAPGYAYKTTKKRRKHVRPRIASGLSATRGQFPHHALLDFAHDKICGGSLVSREWVLTSAQCAESRKSDNFGVGLGVLRQSENASTTQWRTSTQVLLHEEFDKSKSPAPNDIALIKLNEPVELTEDVKTVSLPSSGFDLDEKLPLSVHRRVRNFEQDEALQRKAPIYKRDNNRQGNVLDSSRDDSPVRLHEAKRWTLLGDIGGGIVSMRSGKDFTIVGVLAHVRCDLNGTFAFAPVAPFSKWIREKAQIPEEQEVKDAELESRIGLEKSSEEEAKTEGKENDVTTEKTSAAHRADGKQLKAVQAGSIKRCLSLAFALPLLLFNHNVKICSIFRASGPVCCAPPLDQPQSELNTAEKGVKVTVENFGSINNRVVTRYTLSKGKTIAQVMSYGATLNSVRVPDKKGVLQDVVLGFDNLEGYKNAALRLGATLGRVANRIVNSTFTLNGHTVVLEPTSPSDSKTKYTDHGGAKGWDKAVWNSSVRDDGVTFSLLSPAGDQHFPGSVMVQVVYRLVDNGDLSVSIRALASEITPLNVANNAFFNLAGHDAGPAGLGATALTIRADYLLEQDADGSPTGKVTPASGSRYDLCSPRPFKSILEEGDVTVHMLAARCQSKPGDMVQVATVEHAESGRTLEVYSDQPALRFSSLALTSGQKQTSITGKGGVQYQNQGGFSIVSQNLFEPTIKDESKVPSVTIPGDIYQHNILYKFGVSS